MRYSVVATDSYRNIVVGDYVIDALAKCGAVSFDSEGRVRIENLLAVSAAAETVAFEMCAELDSDSSLDTELQEYADVASLCRNAHKRGSWVLVSRL